jgi:Sulfotransferase domain
MALASCPARQGQQRSLRRIRQFLSWAFARPPGERSCAWGRRHRPATTRTKRAQWYVEPMPVFALWSPPRTRSTAFFRSMVERGDMTVLLHEPFCKLKDFGETDDGGRTFDSPLSLLAWLGEETHNMRVFLKDHPPAYYPDVIADRRFLAETRHAFIIRRPEEIAASCYALSPGTNIESIGLEKLCEAQAAIRDAGGDASVVIDSDDLVARPEATMAAYCAVVGLPFIPQALSWEPGERPEWRQYAPWHVDASASSGFERPEHVYPHTVENSPDLARLAARHRPFHEQLYAQRLDVTPWEHPASS